MGVAGGSHIKSNLTSTGTSRRLPFALTVLCLSASLHFSDLTLFAQDQLLPVFYFQHLKGLKTDQIRSPVVRDPQGFVWVGTLACFNRYNGYSLQEYWNEPNDTHSISSNVVHGMCVDRKKRLWVGTHESGLSLYDPLHDRFINFIPRTGDSSWYQSKSIATLLEDRSGNIWMATLYGGIVRAELPSGNIDDPDSLLHKIHFTTYPLGTPRNTALGMLERDDGRMLIGSDSGMIVLDPHTREISRLHFSDPTGRRLDSLNILSLVQDSQGNLWVGTETNGLFRIDKKSRKVENYRYRKGNDLSLKSDFISNIEEERRGNLWIGSDKGIDLFSRSTGQCIPYLAIGSTPHWPTENMHMSLDSNAVLWVGTIDEGLYWLSQKSQRFPLYGLRDNDGSSPISFTSVERDKDGGYWFMSSRGVLYHIDLKTQRVVKRIDILRGQRPRFHLTGTFIDRHGIYWYCTWGLGLFRVDLNNGHIRNYSVNAGFGPSRTVNSIAQGEGDTLWIAAYRDGLMKFSSSSGLFTKVPGLPAGDVYSVRNDHTGRIWIGSELNGVMILDPKTGSMEHLRHNSSDPRSLSSGRVHYTYEDSSGRMWVGAGNEIDLWDPGTHSFTRFRNSESIQSVVANPIGSDHKGRLWIEYDFAGVAVLDPSNGIFTNFDMTDGITGSLTMVNLPDGRVVLPHRNGINIFCPDSIDVRRSAPPLVITRMSINDQKAFPPPLDASTPLRLEYTQNVLEFEFAAIDIDAPQLVEYQYKLEGLENEWVRPENRRFVRYPGLSPGDYVFKVRAASSRGEWPDQMIELGVSISPPWWRTTWAYAGYGLFIIAFLLGGYQLRLRQIQLKQAAEMEHFQADHLAEVDRLKSRFFANISHEFRTPLTLILGPIRKWREMINPTFRTGGEKSQPTAREEFQPLTNTADLHNDLGMAERNAHRLLRLINQLLDLSKLEAGAMKLRASQMNIVPLVKGIAYSFESSAGIRGVALNVDVEQEEITAYCDKDMMEKILGNLLSNAFKFTPDGGSVNVCLHFAPSPILRSPASSGRPMRMGDTERGRQGDEFLAISVSDTGIGIPPDQLDKVFDRFYQVDASQTREHEGSGIGLALVKELVELHHGTIQVESQVGRGTTFTVHLPLGRSHLKDDEIADVPVSAEPTIQEVNVPASDRSVQESKEGTESESTKGEKPIVLVVEDNADVRAYIREYLFSAYRVMEARDGVEGVEKALELIPDLIISDVMMPEKDGYEVCRTVKLDERTSHVPIILLTAKAASENKMEGLGAGADDYLTKPFEPHELLARIKNLIDLRRKLRERFSAGAVLKPGEVAVASLDDALLRRILDTVEKNVSNEDFSVDNLAREACLSRVQLNRKLHALTNLAPAEFIRYIRLHRAMDLLKKNAGTVAEVAYSVGYGDPSHFSARFHELFGITPGEVRKKPTDTKMNA